MPFRRIDSDARAEVVLAQVSDDDFRLVEGIRYVGPSGELVVLPEDLPLTDLASVPWYLRWFAGRYGRHTPAAVLHDHLVRNGGDLAPPVDRRHADTVFLESLRELDVPPVRAWLMWAAVTLATRYRAPSPWPTLGIVVWVAAAVTGTTVLTIGAATGNLPLAVVAALGPVPFALLWGRELRAGLVAGYGVAIVGVPVVGVLVGYALYWLTEQALAVARRIPPANRRAGVPGPTPYHEL